MELNTVRFVDNFSAGTRGSASTEYVNNSVFGSFCLLKTAINNAGTCCKRANMRSSFCTVASHLSPTLGTFHPTSCSISCNGSQRRTTLQVCRSASAAMFSTLTNTFAQFSFTVSSSFKPKLREILKHKKETEDRLLKITFTTLSEYLFTLRELTLVLNEFGSNTMLYLAAAVSDFYIPPENMVS